jgi:acyl-CoA synthetase (AMP-forming)/AMP-acid ligase II/aryl carrier-like protein
VPREESTRPAAIVADWSHDVETPGKGDDAPATLYRLLAARVQRTPGAVALAAPGRPPLTYGRLLDEIESVRAVLRAAGIGGQDRIAMVLPQSCELAVAFLAVASAAACAPLNPSYTAEEFAFYLADLGAKALLVGAGSRSAALAPARERGLAVIELTPLPDGVAGTFTLATLAGQTPTAPAASDVPDPADVALLLHTSGTTSRPKLVPLTHANLCASAAQIAAAFQLTPTDRSLNVMPLFHIHGLVGALLSSLHAGASVVCAPGFDADRFFDWMNESAPTWFTAVPTMHQALVARAADHADVIARRPLRFIRSCSAALPPRVMAQVEAVFQSPVLESYGMTEAAHQIATNPLPPLERKPGSVGRAAGTMVAIVGEDGRLAPRGAMGEIVVCGANVMAGYERNPVANAQAFTDGWLRTGDQGYLDADDYLHITGRIKELINRGGEKIAPREVDEALLAHPAVAQAVAFAVPHPHLGEDVAAAVVLRPGLAATERELRAFVAERVATFKVPSQVVVVAEIPRGPTGKLQRIGLAEKLGLTGQAGEHAAAFTAPEGAVERALADLWAELLSVGPIGRADNFFVLGGDSIRATQLVARMRSALGIELDLSHIFATPTLAELAGVVEDLLLRDLGQAGEQADKPAP